MRWSIGWALICALSFGVACGGDDDGGMDSGVADGGTNDSGGGDGGGEMDAGMDDAGGGEDGGGEMDAGGGDDGGEMDAGMDAEPDVPPDPCQDTDGDGITDRFERAPTRDTDGDGTPDYLDDDSDGDGIPDADEFSGEDCSAPADSDGDGTPNFADGDSDGNGIDDGDESTGDFDEDGTPDYADIDNDGDGIRDVEEIGDDPASPADSDGDGSPDHMDADSDGDTISDRDEDIVDSDGDEIPNRRDADSDDDGLSDAMEAGDDDPATPPVDTDGDGAPDYIDLDSDGDGLVDASEIAEGTDPLLTDSDGDGASDLVEVASGTDPSAAGDNPASRGDFAFIMPFMDDPEPPRDILDFATDIQIADVYFLMDTTGSMSGSITALQNAIRASLIPSIVEEIPDTHFGVGEFRDYPVSPYGGSSDQPFNNFQDITGDFMAAQMATSMYRASGGRDTPESHGSALHALATGSGLPRSSVGDRAGCPAGTFGYACFRETAVPIVIMVTDVPWHNGPGDSNPYTEIAGEPQYADVVAAFSAENMRFIGIGQGTGGIAHMRQFGIDVDSVDSAGEPFVTTYSGGDAALASTIVDQIRDLIATPIDVSTVFEDDDTDAVNTAEAFLDRIEANEDGDAGRMCAPRAGEDTDADTFPDTFREVDPGDRVCFDVIVRENVTVEQTLEPQVFRATVNVLGDGFTPLDEREVVFIVPPAVQVF